MTSLTLPAEVQQSASRARAARQKPDPGPVLMADIVVAPGGRPSLLALWAAWEEHLQDDEARG